MSHNCLEYLLHWRTLSFPHARSLNLDTGCKKREAEEILFSSYKKMAEKRILRSIYTTFFLLLKNNHHHHYISFVQQQHELLHSTATQTIFLGYIVAAYLTKQCIWCLCSNMFCPVYHYLYDYYILWAYVRKFGSTLKSTTKIACYHII